MAVQDFCYTCVTDSANKQMLTTKKPAYEAYSAGHKKDSGITYIHHDSDSGNIGRELSAYVRGHFDGARDKEAEMMRMAKAVFERAHELNEAATTKLIEAANQYNVTIYTFCLNLVSWDCAKLLIVVKLEDYIDDRIEHLYSAANKISEEISSDSFNWDYAITYHSDKLNMAKLTTDGFDLIYEHTPRPREAQQESV